MLHRITTPGLALVAVALATTDAQAKTVQLTNSGSTTVTKSASGSWTEQTKWGNFGAGYGAGHQVYANYDGSSKYVKVSGEVSGELFGADFEFVDVSVKAHSEQSTTLYGDYFLSSFGVTLINLTNRNLSAPPNSNVEIGGVSFGSDGVSVEKCVEAEQDYDMLFVGIPVTTSAGATGCIGLGVSASAEYTASTKSSAITFTGTPYASIGLSVSAGVGTSVASAGAYGEITLFEASIPVDNTLAVVPTSTSAANTSGTMTYSTSGYLTLSSLAGEIGLYVKVGLLKYTYTLFDWSGITWLETLLFTDSVPVAASPKVVIYGDTATASYTYSDAEPESGSTITWERASSSGGANATDIQSGSSKEWNIDLNDNDKYLRFCVVPSNGVNDGEENCSAWQSVGHALTMYWNTNYGGFARTYAYERSASGTCIDLDDIQMNWNDDVSSYKFYANSACATTLHLYEDADCEGPSVSRAVSAGGSDPVSSMTNTIGSGWNDILSSVRVVYCDSVSASDAPSVSPPGRRSSRPSCCTRHG